VLAVRQTVTREIVVRLEQFRIQFQRALERTRCAFVVAGQRAHMTERNVGLGQIRRQFQSAMCRARRFG